MSIFRAAVFFGALAFGNVDIDKVLKQALEEEDDDVQRRAVGVMAGLKAFGTGMSALKGQLTAVMATVKPYAKSAMGALEKAQGVRDTLNGIIGSSDTNRFIGIEIENKFGAYIKLKSKGTYLQYGYAKQQCSNTIGPAQFGLCGLAKNKKSWTGVYGVSVYRLTHGAPFATNKDDYWVDFAVAYGNPQRFWHAKNLFSLYIAPAGTALTSNNDLFQKMHYRKSGGLGTQHYANQNQPIRVKDSGVRVEATMSDDWKPKIIVEVFPDTALFDSHEDSWGDLRTFYDRECYMYRQSNGLDYGNGCKAYWLHSFNVMDTAKHSYLGAQEICLMNAGCHGFFWSRKRNMGMPTAGTNGILDFNKAEEFNASTKQWKFMDDNTMAGWGVAFFGGKHCDAYNDDWSGEHYTTQEWLGGNQYKCRWTPTSIKAETG